MDHLLLGFDLLYGILELAGCGQKILIAITGPVGGYDFYRSDRVRDIRYREDVKHGLLPGHTIGDICSR